ncbi:hypothetical protein KC363_g8733 [Hortaea werneckii]|uniref:Alpha/beta hydrolase fold-3 domain-containing protein n=1 Tax=Hortaea werneckii TaxID=91943 RepID=A0A3M7EZY8_HORWE|nr:hypothetical protein KC363_g8733 [Hortaea werneckii]RMY81694.1 hypothetical protein D0861_08207 [Hortaea werneckii]
MESTRIPELTLMGKLMLIPHFGKVLLATGLRIFTSPLRLLTGGTAANTWLKDIVYSAIRANISAMTPAQENYVKGTTEAIYLDFAKKAKFQPDTDALPSGMKVHWLGTKNADKIIVYLHGGGYVMPALPGHVQWCYEMAKSMSEQDGRSISCVFPSYTLAPQAQYPTQLKQAVECVDMLISKMGKKPSNIIIAGDSAGGNLALAVLSHVLHPHPQVPKLEISEPFAGAILISPWTRFHYHDAIFDRNQSSDYVTFEAASRWASLYLGGKEYDNYNMAYVAPVSWFEGLEKVARDILVWGGGGEVLIGSIDAIAEKLKKAHPRVEYVVQPGASHEDFIIDTLLGYKNVQGTEVIRRWIQQRL